MPYMMGRVTVENYATFRTAIDGSDRIATSAGALSSAVFQSADDPNEVIVQVEFPTVDAAKAFQGSQELREAMQRAGVQGPPRTLVVNET